MKTKKIGPLAVLLSLTLSGGVVASAPSPIRKSGLASGHKRVEKAEPRPDALSRALSRGRLTKAEYALERARSLFHLNGVRGTFGDVERPDSHDATLLLRDLALRKDDLSRRDRRSANRMLARPTDGSGDKQGDGYPVGTVLDEECFNLDGTGADDACFTWALTGDDAVDPADVNINNYPDYIDDAAAAMTTTWQKIVGDLGYKRPRSDANSANAGVNDTGKLDIYFADIGDDGLYGYCTTDEPGAANKQRVSAYCVLDNDYNPGQYDAPPPEVSGLDALRVTSAHEFFHAVQFNYDWKEAKFLMEGTAVWIEDVVFDGINALYAYLFDSILHQPEIPLDAYQKGDDDENFEYGAFVFFSLLEQTYGLNIAEDIVRLVWVEAEKNGKKGIDAVKSAIAGEGYPGPSTPFRNYFADWGAASYYYDAFYPEGHDFGDTCDNVLDAYYDVLNCNRPPFDAVHILNGPGDTTGMRSIRINHLSHRYIFTFPTGNPASMKFTFNLPNNSRGGDVRLATLFNNGNVQITNVNPNNNGDATKTVALLGTEAEIVIAFANGGPHNNEIYKYKVQAQ